MWWKAAACLVAVILVLMVVVVPLVDDVVMGAMAVEELAWVDGTVVGGVFDWVEPERRGFVDTPVNFLGPMVLVWIILQETMTNKPNNDVVEVGRG
jgi:hypothetical protein